MAKKKETEKKAEKATAAKAVEKKVTKAAEEKPVKKAAAASTVKKTAVKKEQKKLTVKETKKIEAGPQPKKIASAKVEKIETKPVEKLEEKAPALKKETKAKSKAVKKGAVKPESKKTEEKKAVKPAAKKTAKPKTDAKKRAYYEVMSLGDCIMNMQKMQVPYSYEDYTQMLLEEEDVKKLEKEIIAKFKLKEMKLDYEKDGYDADIVAAAIKKVADTMDITAAEFKGIKKEMTASLKTALGEDAQKNAEAYLNVFSLCEKLLMIGQRRGLSDSGQLEKILQVDIEKFTEHFLDLAYQILPGWQYKDVEFYENFICAYVSQYQDLYVKYEQRILLDCADLYIMHGDQRRGDEAYGYILRENEIKDYIYFRFASVYIMIDYEKAKAIAYSALQYVDDRYVYYPNIMEIIQR